MKPEELIDRLDAMNSPPFLIFRERSNYGKFLRLYRALGYGLESAASLQVWENLSIDTWQKVDRVLPNSCTGGSARGNIVSSWGTLPYSPKVVYGHSVCMERTLVAAATLYLQSLQSLRWIKYDDGVEFWGGSYNQNSSFSTGFQTLYSDHLDRQQIRVLAVQFDPNGTQPLSSGSQFEIVARPGFADNRCTTSYRHLEFLIGKPYLDNNLHSVEHFCIVSRNRHVVGHFVFHKSSPFLTAANVFQSSWLFFDQLSDLHHVIPYLRQFDSFAKIGIQVVVEREHWSYIELNGEKGSPIFWVFTPRELILELHHSFQRAFCRVLEKYVLEEIDAVAVELNV